MSFRSRARPLARASERVLEARGTLCFAAGRWLLRPRARPWSSPGGERVLIVAPHPDDEAIGCAGTALLHVRCGDRLAVAIATDGRLSRVAADADEVSKLRRREAEKAAQLMQAEKLAWIGLPEGAWRVPQLQSALSALIDDIEPDIIYAPSRIDFHPEHLQVAHALALALRQAHSRAAAIARVRIYQVQVPLGPLLSNLVADLSRVEREWTGVLQAYASQAGSIRCTYRQRRYGATWQGTAGPVEEFWELSAQDYTALHAGPPQSWRRVFRGLRPRPLTDPLAYLAGIGERRRMATAVRRATP